MACSNQTSAARTLLPHRVLWFAAVGLLLLCSAARAQTDMEWEASAYKGWTVTGVEVLGLEEGLAKELRDGLALAMTSGLLKQNKSPFYPQTLEEDLQRTRLFLSSRGYPYSTVTPRFEPRPDREQVKVLLDIDSGPGVFVSSVLMNGVPTGLSDDVDEQIRVEEGALFVDSQMNETVNLIGMLLTEEGYAKAVVEPHIQWQDTTSVTVIFDLTPGAAYSFGDVTVTGATDDLVPLVIKSTGIKRGRRYSPQAMDNALRNIRVLDLFRQVRLDLHDAEGDVLDVEVVVTLREPRSFNVALQWWSEEKLNGGISWTHRNFFKRGRGLKAFSTASPFLQQAKISAWWPGLLVARGRVVVTGGVERESEDAYELAGTGIELAGSFYETLVTQYRVGFSVSDLHITEKTLEFEGIQEQEGLVTILSLSWQRNARNDWISPTAGTYARIWFEVTPDEPLSESHFIRLEPTGSLYVPLRPEWIFATRLTLGLARPTYGSETVIPNKRFYSGGAASHRGFDRRKLGPKDSLGAPIGGEIKIEGSVEFRFPLLSLFRATLFVDYGQVWFTRDDINNEIEIAVGPGLWIKTAVGPLRFDYGYRITNYDKTQPRGQFHFAIGPAF